MPVFKVTLQKYLEVDDEDAAIDYLLTGVWSSSDVIVESISVD